MELRSISSTSLLDDFASPSTFQELDKLSAPAPDATDAGNANAWNGDARGFELRPEDGEE